jgi:hypothetical protein
MPIEAFQLTVIEPALRDAKRAGTIDQGRTQAVTGRQFFDSVDPLLLPHL